MAHAGAQEVAQADDPDEGVVLDHGEVAEPAAEHDLGRSPGVDVALDGLRVAGHPADTGVCVRSVPDAAARSTSRS